MLNNVTAWVEARPDTRMDNRAFLACMFDLKINASNETMFRACWHLATIPGQACAQPAAATGAGHDRDSHVIAYRRALDLARRAASSIRHDCTGHVIAYRRALGIARRAANAVRHDLRRSFSPRFF